MRLQVVRGEGARYRLGGRYPLLPRVKASSRGVDFVGRPEKQPWGGVLAHLRDPEGNILTLLGRGN